MDNEDKRSLTRLEICHECSLTLVQCQTDPLLKITGWIGLPFLTGIVLLVSALPLRMKEPWFVTIDQDVLDYQAQARRYIGRYEQTYSDEIWLRRIWFAGWVLGGSSVGDLAQKRALLALESVEDTSHPPLPPSSSDKEVEKVLHLILEDVAFHGGLVVKERMLTLSALATQRHKIRLGLMSGRIDHDEASWRLDEIESKIEEIPGRWRRRKRP